jgi:hypothetical protein
MRGGHGSGSTYRYWKGPAPAPAAEPGLKPETMGVREERDNKLDEIRAAIEASRDKIVLIVSRDHWGNKEGEWHADKLKLPNGERGWAHAAVAFLDKDGNVVLVEKTPGTKLGPLPVAVFSPNKSGTVPELVTGYKEVVVIPIDLSRFGPGARERFLTAFLYAASRPYSALAIFGDHCSGAFQKGLEAAADQSKMSPVGRAVFLEVMKLFRFTFALNTYTPNDAYLDGKKLGVPFLFDPFNQGTVKGDGKYSNLDQPMASASAADHTESRVAILTAATAAILTETRTSPPPAADDDQRPSQQEREDAADDEDALTDDVLQPPGTDDDDDEDALEEEVLASDPKDTLSHDPAQQPAIDDEDKLTLVSDPEDARTDGQQPAIDDDDDEEPLQGDDEEEELADVSDTEDAPTADTLMQAAKAEVGADATADDQQGHQLVTSAPDIPDAGFSFSLFPKPGVPTEVAKEAMPAEQPSPEAIPGSGVPGSESAHPDLDSANVGNAAPNHERVVHHGDLAP